MAGALRGAIGLLGTGIMAYAGVSLLRMMADMNKQINPETKRRKNSKRR